jgi:hypothetical protein
VIRSRSLVRDPSVARGPPEAGRHPRKFSRKFVERALSLGREPPSDHGAAIFSNALVCSPVVEPGGLGGSAEEILRVSARKRGRTRPSAMSTRRRKGTRMAPEPSAAVTTQTSLPHGGAAWPAGHPVLRVPEVALRAAATPGPGPGSGTGGRRGRVAGRRAAGCNTASSPAAAGGADTDAVSLDAGHRWDRYPTVGPGHPGVASRVRGHRRHGRHGRRDPLGVGRRPGRDSESPYADTSPWSSGPLPPAVYFGTDRLASGLPSANGPTMTVSAVPARVPPMHPARCVLPLGVPSELGSVLRAPSAGSGAGSPAATVVTDRHWSGRWLVDRTTPAAASPRRPAAGARGGRDA